MFLFNSHNNVENHHHVSGKIRAYGKARLDMAHRATNRQEWDALWKESRYPFPFQWGNSWRFCMEYRVDDFAAEIGFWIDMMGFSVVSLDDHSAVFCGPDGDLSFAVAAAGEGQSTPVDAIRLQFMIRNIYQAAEELKKRGIELAHEAQPYSENSPLHYCSICTPHGIAIDLWEYTEADVIEPERPAVEQKLNSAHRPQQVIVEADEDAADAHEPVADAGDEDFEEIRKDGFEYIREPEYEDLEESSRVYDSHANNELHYKPIPYRKN